MSGLDSKRAGIRPMLEAELRRVSLAPIADRANRPHDSSVGALIRYAKATKIPWIITDLWQEGGIALVHSLEGEFKSILSYQIAEAVAAGSKLLRSWDVPRPRRVGILETEMDDLEVGRRLASMYPNDDWPATLEVSNNALLQEYRRKSSLSDKLTCVDRWLKEEQLEVLVWDTINSILATGDPNSERSVSHFFDGIALLPTRGNLIVRHDVKPSKDAALRSSNQLVRGSNRLVEDASLVIHLKRLDKAAHKVSLAVGKLRNAPMPEPLELWFDARTFRLTPLPPMAALLEEGPLSRQELITQAEKGFNLKQRTADAHRAQARFLNESMSGHQRVIAIDRDFRPEPESPEAGWWGLLKPARATPG